MRGGAEKTKVKVSKFIETLPKDDEINITIRDKTESETFLKKIVEEGKYINHTIGMIIFAAMCVGESLKTEKNDVVDNFDDFGKNLIVDIQNNYICTRSSPLDCTKTVVLLHDMNYSAILASSCIWLQIIFSFLYWNKETQESTNYWLENNDNYENERKEEYIEDMQEFDFYNGVPMKYVELCSNINFGELDSIRKDIVSLNDNYSTKLVTKIDAIKYNGTKLIIDYKIKDLSQTVLTFKFDVLSKNEYDESVTEKYELTTLLLNVNDLAKKIAEFNDLYDLIVDFDSCTKSGTFPNFKSAYNSCRSQVKFNDIANKVNFLQKYISGVTYVKTGSDSVTKSFDELFIGMTDKSARIPFILILEMCKEIKKNHIPNIEKHVVEIDTIKKTIESLETRLNLINELKQLLEHNYYLSLLNNSLVLFDSKDVECGPIFEIISSANNVPELKTSSTTEPSQSILNQMHRVQDGRIAATKMVLMHLVTGQGIKHFMVKDTIELAGTLYNSTDLQLGPTETKATVIGGNVVDTEKYNTKYESYQPSSLSKLPKLTRLPSLPSLNNSMSNSPNNN